MVSLVNLDCLGCGQERTALAQQGQYAAVLRSESSANEGTMQRRVLNDSAQNGEAAAVSHASILGSKFVIRFDCEKSSYFVQ